MKEIHGYYLNENHYQGTIRICNPNNPELLHRQFGASEILDIIARAASNPKFWRVIPPALSTPTTDTAGTDTRHTCTCGNADTLTIAFYGKDSVPKCTLIFRDAWREFRSRIPDSLLR